MQIFKDRPLCFIISLLTAFMAVSPFVPAATKLIIASAAAGVSVLIILCQKRDDKLRFKIGTIVVALLLLFFTILRSYFFYDRKMRDANRIEGISSTAEMKVEEVLYSDNYTTTLSCRSISICGEEIDLNVYLECDYQLDFEPSDVISLNVTVYNINDLKESDTMSDISILSGGYHVYCISTEDSATLVKRGSGVRAFLERLNSKLSSKLISLLGEKSGSLASAIALGNDSRVPDDVMRDFRRSGLSHILALSGSHIVLIIGSVEYILRKFFLAGKRVRYPIMLLSLPFYIILVMSPIPVVRAGIMYGVFCLVQLINRKSDSLTNLFLSLFVMIIVRPNTVFNMSLWMSFVATLALIAFLPVINKQINSVKSESKRRKKILLIASVAVTSSALTTLVGFLSNVVFMPAFGTFSTVSIFTNVIFGPLLTLFLVLAMFIILLIPLPLLQRILILPTAKLGEIILRGISSSASYKYSVVSLKAGFADEACIIFFVIMAIFLIVKVRRKWLAWIPVTAFACAICLNSCLIAIGDGNAHIYGTVRSQSETIVASVGDDFSLIDISNGRYTNLSAATKLAKENGACEFESLVLTHYHRYHVSSVRRFLQKEIVRSVLIPTSVNDYDLEIQQKLIIMLNSLGVPYSIYDNKNTYQITGNVCLKAYPIERLKRSTHALIAFEIGFEDERLTYVGSSVNDGNIGENVLKNAANSSMVIFGIHGPVQKTMVNFVPQKVAIICINHANLRKNHAFYDTKKCVFPDENGVFKLELCGKNE